MNIKSILTGVLSAVTSCVFAQTQLLKSYDFDKGGYYIIGVRSESDRSTLADSIGEFYTDDIKVLNAFKKEWIFDKPSPQYACGFHYEIVICKQRQVLESFAINLNCNEIASDQGFFHFNQSQLRMFKGKLKKPIRKTADFKTIVEAREFREKILSDTSLLLTATPAWTKFEGQFDFTYRCKGGTKTCMDKEDSLKKVIKATIEKTYPDEKFELMDRGGSWTEISQIIKCNKSLSDKFKLFYRDQGLFGKWEPYHLYLTSYWKARSN